MVDQHQVCLGGDRPLKKSLRGRDCGDDPQHLGPPFDLQTIGAVVGYLVDRQKIIKLSNQL